ncbi:NAD(P)H-dependent flavin oxidoreductase [Janthinobacterium agaricidamnosum]|uniref:Nitronate monooxygenase n=1 Tax=Janthinobacterium agaricidamnosum NBRC 102515 = DSM 9628 TaxID=1349767 RepID=W0V2H8_9BURK|nr:nitronate monooxygenase [Janthinobacterium agaricidamnosum]CDG81553.1 2-nitropropane dioxygenase family protein [Janthinobacterium agaricidamnosum NBRC 102515 = DSM 9628]
MKFPVTSFATTTGIDHPIIQGPMNGGSPCALAAAVSNAGALGSFAAALLSPQAIIDSAAKLRRLTTRPFNVNLFVLETPEPQPYDLAAAQSLLAPFRSTLELGAASVPQKFSENFRDQLAALLEAAPPVVSFTFGVVDSATVRQFQRAGSLVIGTATTVAEAQAWESAGADFICASGAEAGGHRATFLADTEQSCIGLMALIPQVAAAVRLPVIAAGGIMNGRGIAASLMLGAHAAQLGTAFLACDESGIAPAWRRQLALARDDSTRLTRVFSGRYARGIVNEFMEKMRPFEQQLPVYPVQNVLTQEIRQEAARQSRPEFMSLWAGQGVAMARPMPAAQLVDLLVEELRAIFADLRDA